MNSSFQVLSEMSGKAANASYGFLTPALFGTTTLQLSETRLVERTKKLIATRNCEVLLSEVDSVEITEDGVTLLLALGLATLAIGIGIIFIVLYFLIKYKYLIIRSGSNVQVVCIGGASSMQNARGFMTAVLDQAEKVKPHAI